MKKAIGIIISSLLVSGAWAEMDCPEDSSYHIDTRTMLPDGSPNPTYGQEITTGLCACLGYVDGVQVNGNEVTFTIRIVDHEPIRGIELDIYHDAADLEFSGYAKGSKLENVTDEEGTPRTMTLLTNYLEDHLKVLAYSTSRARTEGNGEEGDLCHITYTLADGASLPEQVTFYFGLAKVPGTSMDPELLNVVCGYPDENNPAVVSTATVAADAGQVIPDVFALNQNYPNPFNPLTKNQYQLPYQTDVNLSIYDILGNEVIVLVHQNQSPGTYNIIWDAVDRNGREVSGGVYFYRIKTREFTKTKKLILLK